MRFQCFSAAIVLMGVTVASAQVASHAPTLADAPKGGMNASAPAPKKMVTGRAVAKVNGAVLTDRDLLREMYAMFPYAQQHDGGFPKDMEPQIRKGALDMLIFEELVYQDAKRRNVTVPPAKLAKAKADFRKQFPNQQEYEFFLKVEANGSKKEMDTKIQRSLIIDQVLKAEVTGPAKVTPLQAKAYYDKNPKLFQRAEMIHIQSISILPPPNKNPEIAKEAKRKAEEAYKQAKVCKNYQEFGLLAEKLSDDDFHVKMGDHKPVEREKLPPPIVSAALKMKPGQVSDLIQLGDAYTIIRLVAHTQAGTTPYAEVKAKLQSDLQKTRTEQLRSALGKKLRKDAKIETL